MNNNQKMIMIIAAIVAAVAIAVGVGVIMNSASPSRRLQQQPDPGERDLSDPDDGQAEPDQGTEENAGETDASETQEEPVAGGEADAGTAFLVYTDGFRERIDEKRMVRQICFSIPNPL